ncbi:methyltransferase domain-containing protein [Dehalococcoidia bacterium]|nr:methyltransferase domain-containing protein [Dehalococcoidia bacterium]
MLTLLQQAGVTLGQKVLDVGFRDVQELQAIASLIGPTGNVLGIDVVQQYVESVRGKLGELSVSNISVKEGSVLNIPADDQSFDMILCKGVLHEVRQLDKALIEMRRVCKRDGLITVVDFQRFSRFRFELYRIATLLRGHRWSDVHPGFTREQLLRLILDQQLEEVSYQQLSDKWRMGFNAVCPFLLKVKWVS